MRFLIVEDEFASRKLLETILADYGDCDTAVNGAEGLEMFIKALEEDRPYDLICLDIMMPVMDGHKTLQHIRETEKARGVGIDYETKVIMCTALNDSNTVVKAYYKGGASAYLTKPIEIDQLINVLKDLEIIDL